MHNKHYDLFLEYFDATCGRYYTVEQRQRLLTLLLGSNGIYRGSEEYRRIADAVATLEAEDIRNLTESRNYQLLCDMIGLGDDVRLAASALVDVFGRMTANRERQNMRYLDWIIFLKKANPKTDEICMEIAYFEYANENVEKAIKELGDLVNGGSIVAVHHLAFIYLDSGRYKEAYYYFSLLKGVYTKQLEIPVGDFVDKGIATARANITDAEARLIDTDMDRLTADFPLCKKDDRVTVGFMSSTERRFTYEY